MSDNWNLIDDSIDEVKSVVSERQIEFIEELQPIQPIQPKRRWSHSSKSSILERSKNRFDPNQPLLGKEVPVKPKEEEVKKPKFDPNQPQLVEGIATQTRKNFPMFVQPQAPKMEVIYQPCKVVNPPVVISGFKDKLQKHKDKLKNRKTELTPPPIPVKEPAKSKEFSTRATRYREELQRAQKDSEHKETKEHKEHKENKENKENPPKIENFLIQGNIDNGLPHLQPQKLILPNKAYLIIKNYSVTGIYLDRRQAEDVLNKHNYETAKNICLNVRFIPDQIKDKLSKDELFEAYNICEDEINERALLIDDCIIYEIELVNRG